jgi:amino-acid N-acetyltransferase
MNIKPEIRKAKIEEYTKIKNLIKMFPKQLVFPIPKVGSFFVAEVDDKIVGCCALDIYSKRIAEIRSLAVLPEFNGIGIGSRLLKACLQRAKTRKIAEVFVVTSNAGMFKKFGFNFEQQEKYILFIK